MQQDTGKLFEGTKEELASIKDLKEIRHDEYIKLHSFEEKSRPLELAWMRYLEEQNKFPTQRQAFEAGFKAGKEDQIK